MKNLSPAVARADRVLLLAFAIILATASAAVSAAVRMSAPTDDFSSVINLALSPYDLSPTPPRPGPITPEITSGEALQQLIAEHGCLAEVMYYEARGEGAEGEQAVAEVVLRRLNTGAHGRTICAVVYQGSAGPYCQFTFACDGSLERPKEPGPWRRSQILAAQILAHQADPTGKTEGATNYHATSVMPRWASRLTRIVQIGNHVFYRPRETNRPVPTLRGAL